MRRVTLLLAVSLLSTRCATSSEAPGTSVGRAAGPTSSNAQATLAQGEAALKRSDWKSAEALLTQAEREDPRSARASALLATAIFHQARWADALAAAQRSLAKGETFEARLVEGRVLAAQRKFEGAIASFERCTVLDPGSADAWSALSGARLAVGEQAGAERAYAEVAKRLPRIEAEDHIWTDILRMQPDPLQIQEALDRCARGTAAYMAGQYPEARYEQVVVLGTVPQYGHCWSELGKTSWKLGKLDDAEQYFRRARAIGRTSGG
jgi:tetratricopeptide (TPR) repeat protein